MLSKIKTIQIFNYPIKTFNIANFFLINIFKLFQNFNFNLSVINIKLFIFTNFSSNQPFLWVFHVDAHDNLTKRSLIDYFLDFVPIPKLLSYFSRVKPFFVRNWILVWPSYSAHSVDFIIISKLNFLKFSKIVSKLFKSFLRVPTFKHFFLVLLLHLKCTTLRAWSFRFCWLSTSLFIWKLIFNNRWILLDWAFILIL